MVLLGGAMYGTMSSFVKLSYSWGYNAAEISFAQAALAAIFLGTYTLVTGKSIQGKITRKDLLPLILTGSAIGVTNYLYYQSVNGFFVISADPASAMYSRLREMAKRIRLEKR